jgi:uncharacterized membrane protein HdeD (DUF308 family)
VVYVAAERSIDLPRSECYRFGTLIQGGSIVAENEATTDNGLVDTIRSNATLALIIGIVMIVAGLLAIGTPAVAGLSITIMVGAMLAVSGISQCFLAFKAGAFGRGLVMFIVGVLMAFAGFYMMSQPVSGLASLTILLMAYLIASGILEIGVAFQVRPAQGWGLELANGIITLLLGIMLWNQFPLSGIWAIGVLFGIKMIFSGWALIFISRAAKQATDRLPGSAAS